MPQMIVPPPGSLLGRMANNVPNRFEGEQEASDLFQIEFEPASLRRYEDVFAEFEKAYQEVTGKKIRLADGATKVKTFSREADSDANHDYNMFKNNAMEVASQNPKFRIKLSKGQKEKFADRWAKETFGMIDYMGDLLPPKDTSEGVEMRKRFGSIVDNIYNNHIARGIQADAEMTANFHSTDSPGQWGKQMLGTAEIAVGTGLQANTDLLAGLEKFLTKVDMDPTNDWEGNTEGVAEKIFEAGKFIEERGRTRYQEADPPSGRYDQPVIDRSKWDLFTDIGYMAYKGTQSAGSQVITTGLGVTASTLAQLHPAARGAGFIVRSAYGLAASSPALAAGYILESGDAYGSARDHLRELRYKAKAEKSDLSPEEFKSLYSVALSPTYSITADLLGEKDIDKISKEIAMEYGMASTGVEALSNLLQAGSLVRQGAKALGITLGKKGVEKEVSKIFAHRAVRNILGVTGAAAKNVVVEGITEGVQEYIQESMLSKKLPLREKNMEQVWDAAYAGGVFGGGVSLSVGTAGAIRGNKKQRDKEITIEERKEQAIKDLQAGKHNEDFDTMIIGGKLLGKSPDEIADAIAVPGVEGKSTRAMIKRRFAQIHEKIIEIQDNPAHAVAWLKKNKEELELQDFEINELTLSYLMFQPSQIANILGVDVTELANQSTVPSKKPKPLSANVAERDAIINDSFDESLLEDSDINMAEDPYDQGFDDPYAQIENIENIQRELLQKELAELESATSSQYDSPEERQIKIEQIKKQLAELNIKPKPTKTKDVDIDKLDWNQMRGLAKQRGIKGYKNKEELKQMLKDFNPKKVPVKEASVNVAKNLVAQTKILFEGGIVLPQDILEGLSDEALFNHAKQVLAKTEPYVKDNQITDRNGLIGEILEKQGPVDLQAGVGIVSIKQRNLSKLRRLFRQGWYQTLQYSSDVESSEGLFRKWVEEYVGPLLPEHFKEPFYDWANDFKPEQTVMGKMTDWIATKIQSKPTWSQAFESDIKDTEHALAAGTDWLKEAIAQQNSQGADIHAENFTHLNSTFFEAMDVVLKKDTYDELTETARNSLSFNEFVENISNPRFGLVTSKGLTPADVIAQDTPLARKLKQFYVGNLTENNVQINRGELEDGESTRRKTVNYQINRDSRGWQNPTVKIREEGKLSASLPGFARATMADRFVNVPVVWLNGSDVTKTSVKKDVRGMSIMKGDGSPFFIRQSIYGFLTADDLREITSEKFVGKGLVPLFIKGDADRIGLIKITDIQRGANPVQYWEGEVKRDPALESFVDSYLGKDLTDEEMSTIYNSPEDYRAANIARHEAYKELLGEDYHTLSAHKIMHRIKILFTPALTRTGGRKSSIKLLDLTESKMGKQHLITKTHYKSGQAGEKVLIKNINNELQYTGDGMTITSERVFQEKYFTEIGANPLAKRAKTVKVVVSDEGTLLMKHQEMTFNLPTDATHSDIIHGTKKVAEIRREKGQVNIYTEDENGNYTKYIDHLATTDEAKVTLGGFNRFDEVLEIPSEATGHIMLTEADKQKAPFPMQVTNYINDPKFLEELNELITDPNNPGSAAKLLATMVSISQSPQSFDQFLKNVKSKHPDSMPRMIIEMAKLGAGLHPTQLDYGQVLIKNRLFSEAMDVKQEGGVLDFRPDLVSDVEPRKIVLPFNHDLKQAIARKLETITKLDFSKIMKLSKKDLNQLIRNYPIKVLLVRHPVPSRAGYRILTIDRFDEGIGDSFMINDEDVKEVFEGDFDHDTGHIAVLPDRMMLSMEKHQTFQDEMGGLDLNRFAKDIKSPSIGNLNNTMDLMGEMAFGQTSIGEVANVQRIAGIGQLNFGSIEIEGKSVKMRKLSTKVLDKDIGEEMSLEELYRHYAQAAFDNVKLRLLKKWNYSQEKLYKMLFYNSDGSEISDIQYQVLNKSIIPIMKMTQAIKNGQQYGNTLSLRDLMETSDQYNLYVNGRQGYIRAYVNLRQIELADGQKKNAGDFVGKIEMHDVLHPHEKLAIMPINYLEYQKVTLDNFFIYNDLKSANTHNIALREVTGSSKRVNDIMDAINVTSFENVSEDQQQEILREIDSGQTWGAHMRQAMNVTYQTIEENDKGEKTDKIANSMTWDYNPEFVEFVDRWLDGFDREDGGYQRGYNDLTEVEKVAATHQFLEGVYDPRDNMNKFNVRKVPPVSKRNGESLLHPGIMQEYFNAYNRVIQDVSFNHERYNIVPINKTYQKTMKEYFGCE
jgi:hypothetical protein